MMIGLTTRMAAGLALVTLLAGPAAAQGAPSASCLDSLGALDRRMDQDGFWLSGYRASLGWSGVATPPGTEPNMGVRAPGLVAPGGAVAAGAAPTRPPAGTDARTDGGVSPFAAVDWDGAPAQALRMLFAAAQILGQTGREEPCRAVLAAAEQDYEGYIERLRQAGVRPADISSWREKQLAIARPVAEAGPLPSEVIEGTDLRNPRDEYLGRVADLVIGPGGEPALAVVRRGGFLGVGGGHVAVPWQALRVTPGLDAFVLDATRAQMDAAPRLDRNLSRTPEAHGRLAEDVRAFWSGQSAATGGGG